MANTISLSQAARILGVTVKTLQRWEQEGRLLPVARTAINRRVSTVEHIQACQGIRHAQLTIVPCLRARLSGLRDYHQAFTQALKDPA